MPRIGNPPVIISHRGHAESLENTIKSFHESIDMGAEMLELDVRLTKDNVPIVFHDNSLSRITGKKSGSVSSRTSAFLTQIDLGDGLRITSLATALAELTPRVPVNVEMKFSHLNYRPLVSEVCALIGHLGVSHRVLISSFFHQSLDIVHTLNPSIATAPLFGRETGMPHPDDFKKMTKRRKYWNSELPILTPAAVVAHTMIDQQLAKQFAKRDLSLLTYTVDEEKDMHRLIDLGVDGIISNRPSLLKKVVSERFDTSGGKEQPLG